MYSPDIARSDYHLFRSLQNFLVNKRYDKYEDMKMDIKKFFDKKIAKLSRKQDQSITIEVG